MAENTYTQFDLNDDLVPEEKVVSSLENNLTKMKSSLTKFEATNNIENSSIRHNKNYSRVDNPNWLAGFNLLHLFPEISGPINGLAKSVAGYKIVINGEQNHKIEQLLFNNYDLFNIRYKMALDYLSAGNPHIIAKYRDNSDKSGLKLKVAPSHMTGNYHKAGDDVLAFEWYSPENTHDRTTLLKRYWDDGEWQYPDLEWDEIKYPNNQWEYFGLSPLIVLENEFKIFSLFQKNVQIYYENGSKTGTVYNFKTPEGADEKEYYKKVVKPFLNALRKQENINGGFAHKSHAVTGLADVFTDQKEIGKFIDNETREEYKKDVLALFNIPLEKAGLSAGSGGINSDRYQIMQTAYYEEAVKCHADALDALCNSFVAPRIIEDPAFLKMIEDLDIPAEDLKTMRIENKKILTETEGTKAERYFKAFDLGIISKQKTQEEVFGFTEEDKELDVENQIEDAIEENVIEDITNDEKVEEEPVIKFTAKIRETKDYKNFLFAKHMKKNYKRKKKINRLVKDADFSPIDNLIETKEFEDFEKNIEDALKQSYESNLETISELVLSKDTKKQVKTIVEENNVVLSNFLKTEDIIEQLVFFSEAAERVARQCGVDNDNPDYNADVAERVKAAREAVIKVRLANLNDNLDFVKNKDDRLLAEIKNIMEVVTQEDEGNISNLTAQLTALLLSFDKDSSLDTTTRKNLVKWIEDYIKINPNTTPADLQSHLEDQIDKKVEQRKSLIAQDNMVTIFGASAFVGMNVFAPRTKTWLRTRSIAPRDFHLAQVGETVDYNELFSSGEFWSNQLPKCKCGITVRTKVFADWGGISFRKPTSTIITS